MKAFYSLIIFSILGTSSNLMGEKNLNDASHKIFLNEIQHELKIFRIDYDQKGAPSASSNRRDVLGSGPSGNYFFHQSEIAWSV